ncbi:hypothetical protein F5X98DRAFT_235386 [Xylaria grammica]|nr:hypothetical protein F5X98DRAFT_235386 [Xylaria grammica]
MPTLKIMAPPGYGARLDDYPARNDTPITCGTTPPPRHRAASFYNSHSSTATAEPVPVSVETVAALLDAGADPNALTLVDPARGRQHYTTSAEPTVPLAMASCCAHAPAEAVRLLLNAGADPRVYFSTAGCAGSMRGSSDLLYWLRYDEAVVKDGDLERDRKLLYLFKVEGQKSGRIGTLVLSGEKVERMLSLVTSVRAEIASILWEVPSRVTVSGVYALLDIWVREREAILGYFRDEEITPARETLKGLERLVAMVLGFRDIVYLDRKIARRAVRIDLGVGFSKSRDSPATGNIEEFARSPESQGLF